MELIVHIYVLTLHAEKFYAVLRLCGYTVMRRYVMPIIVYSVKA